MVWHKLLISFIICLLLFSFKKDDPEIKIVFTGDILLSRNVRTEIQTRHSDPWEHLKNLFHSADLVIGNLEGAVGDGKPKIASEVSSPVFNIDSTMIPLLKDAGFRMITLENNHSLDLGLKGKMETEKQLLKNKITPVFYNNSPQFCTLKNKVIAIVALNIVLGRDSSKNQLPSIEIQQKLRLAKSLADLVIISIHWGSELLDWPGKEQRETAKWLIKNGADIIIGSHPHVIQAPEVIDGKPVFFSLGNHLFDQKYPKSKEGLIAEITISKDELHYKGYLTHTQQNSFYPFVTKEVDLALKPMKLSRTAFEINGFVIKPISFPEIENNKIILKASKQNRLIWQTHPMPIVTISKAKTGDGNEQLFILEKHYSKIDKGVNIRPYVYQLDNNGIYALWRGSAMAWPLLDAKISPYDPKTLIVLHRGDSFIKIDSENKDKRVALYKWNGFGFKGITDSLALEEGEKLFSE